ncbi:MAG: metallophosphoesterase [Candidatus Aenigmarchaeota archaeon]|nr:metallophosphoesterase [Candidatus Aenigmarchaeota archaeon]
MLIAATADIHSPTYFDLFLKAVEELNVKPDVFLLAGDIVENGRVEEWERVYNVLFGKITCPIVATFGNNEFGKETQERIRSMFPDIHFLQDEKLVLNINNMRVGIVGTIGSIEKPTYWQLKNFPDVRKEFEERIKKIETLLKTLTVDFKILLMHYAPTFKILEGEEPFRWPGMGHRGYERVLVETKPDLVICAHAHNGKKKTFLDSVPVFNVALPLHKRIVIIDTKRDLKAGLEKFF